MISRALRQFLAIALLLLGTCTGCTKYEYDITRPVELAAHVSFDADTNVSRDPLKYKLRAVESRLVVNIENPTDDAIQLVGEKSTIVDFNGQSHPVQSRVMAPHSFVKLILPPIRPTFQRSGPSIGIGVGTVVGDSRDGYRRRRGYGNDPFYDNDELVDRGGPQYLTLVDTDDSVYWDWDGEGQIRISLSFSRGSGSFTQEFVISRKKMG